MFYKSYRAKLLVYMVMLIVFLSVTLGYSYQYVQQVFLSEADNHLLRLKQLLNGHLNAEREELQRYATIVAQDLRLREYMYVITGIGGDSEPLIKLYEREFGWLPIDRKIIMTNDGQALVGEQHTDLIDAIQKYTDTSGKGIFYFQGHSGLEVVASSPIKYRDNVLGQVAVSRLLSKSWLENNKQITEGEFFLIGKHAILDSTLPATNDTGLELEHNKLITNSVAYRVYQIDLPGHNTDKPGLWFGLSENEIITKLEKHRQFMLGLLGTGIVGVLFLGLLIIRNFSRPLNQIMQITRQVAVGELPALEKHKVKNEFDELANHFADMIIALRQQQDEIEETHRILEKSAITDTLTGLHNRRYLQEIFPKLLARTQREGQLVYAILLDLDHFKKINDTFGHMAGDQCLISFAEQLRLESRSSDYLFRIGGEEFLILSVHNDVTEASNFAEKIRLKVEEKRIRHENNLINLTVSGGISCASASGDAENILADMLSQADVALYDAKRSGRNRIYISDDLKRAAAAPHTHIKLSK